MLAKFSYRRTTSIHRGDGSGEPAGSADSRGRHGPVGMPARWSVPGEPPGEPQRHQRAKGHPAAGRRRVADRSVDHPDGDRREPADTGSLSGAGASGGGRGQPAVAQSGDPRREPVPAARAAGISAATSTACGRVASSASPRRARTNALHLRRIRMFHGAPVGHRARAGGSGCEGRP